MEYDSVVDVDSTIAPGVRYRIARMSFARRLELMQRIGDLAKRSQFLQASPETKDLVDAGLAQAEIERIFLSWGLRGVSGLRIDGNDATPELLLGTGPEELCREALEAVRRQTGLSETERKN